MSYTEEPSRLDRIELVLATVAEQQATNTVAIANVGKKLDGLSDSVQQLTDNVDRVLARNAILDDVLLELREGHDEMRITQEQMRITQEQMRITQEQHRQEFLENQRVTNAALNQLGAILVQLTRIDPQN